MVVDVKLLPLYSNIMHMFMYLINIKNTMQNLTFQQTIYFRHIEEDLGP